MWLCDSLCASTHDRDSFNTYSIGDRPFSLQTSAINLHTLMNSYNQLSTDSQPIENENLIRVRQGLTAQPQNSLADFKVQATSYGLEVQFSQRRLRDFPAFNAKLSESESAGLTPLMTAATILLVGGSVVLTHSTIFGILVAIAIPAFWKIATPSDGPTQSRIATLRFVNTPKDQTVLSLTTAPASRAHRLNDTPTQPYAAPNKANKNLVHFSNLPVQVVSAKVYVIGGQLSLTLYERDAKGKNKLRITGTRPEIEWLHARIDRWAKETAPQVTG